MQEDGGAGMCGVHALGLPQNIGKLNRERESQACLAPVVLFYHQLQPIR